MMVMRPSAFVTHVMPIQQINHAFDLMHEGKSIRSVVTFGGK